MALPTECSYTGSSSLEGRLPLLREEGQDPAWDAYLSTVYGDVVYPVDLRTFSWFYYNKLPLHVVPARLDILCPSQHFAAWIGGHQILPEAWAGAFGFFVQQFDRNASNSSLRHYHRAFAPNGWAEVMRVALLQRDERFATYYWEARGSGIWMNLGRTRVIPWDIDFSARDRQRAAETVNQIIKRESQAERFDTLQMPDMADLGEVGMFPLHNNRFEIIKLVPGSNVSDPILLHRMSHSMGIMMPSIQADVRTCHVSYMAGWRHDRPCACDEHLPSINCGKHRWRAVVGAGWQAAASSSRQAAAAASTRSWTKHSFGTDADKQFFVGCQDVRRRRYGRCTVQRKVE